MLRHCTRSLLLSSRLITQQFTITPLNKFATHKAVKPLSTGFLINKNVFTFAELPKHQVLTVIFLLNADASLVAHHDLR